mmetsp:Transcript_35869/g.48472  ORF Transcript_35869/g.48472 Transcript_35869/m.48472 type:complete len:115 (-) Transcript_35869:123-467(-)
MDRQVLPFLVDDFDPDLLIVCAGFDGLSSDAYASHELAPDDYGELSCMVRDRLRKMRSTVGRGRPTIVDDGEHGPFIGDGIEAPLVLGLEGGYDLEDGGLGAAVVATVSALTTD